jgi:hypothetical protein
MKDSLNINGILASSETLRVSDYVGAQSSIGPNDTVNVPKFKTEHLDEEIRSLDRDLQRINDRTNAFIHYIRVTIKNVEDYIETAPWTERIFHWIRYREAKTRLMILKTILHACETGFKEE